MRLITRKYGTWKVLILMLGSLQDYSLNHQFSTALFLCVISPEQNITWRSTKTIELCSISSFSMMILTIFIQLFSMLEGDVCVSNNINLRPPTGLSFNAVTDFLQIHCFTWVPWNLPLTCFIQQAVAYATDYWPQYVPQVELLTRKLYEHGTCTSWKSILYPSKWCLFQWAAIYSCWAVLYTIEVSFDQSSTTRTYYWLCIW